MNIVAIDFGTGDALALWGPGGHIRKRDMNLPRVQGGATQAGDFIRCVEWCFSQGFDVVCESPTIGSSGCEIADVVEILAKNLDRTMYTLSSRAVKNYRLDNSITSPKNYVKYEAPAVPDDQVSAHILDAEILYIIATTKQERLQVWHNTPKLVRFHTSVRPHDKRNYKGPIPDSYMNNAPNYLDLPPHLQSLFGDKKKYLRAAVMPLLMAMQEEEGTHTRAGFERVLGLYDHGYPSFYRRCTITLMQKIGKEMAGVTKFAEVSPEIRKQAWRTTRRHIREFYHICRS